MKKFMDWMSTSFAPKMNKVARNPWVASIQEAIITSMPVIFIGSIITLVNIVAKFVEIPDLGAIGTFSIGMLSVYLSFLVPYTIMEKKKFNKTKKEAGIAGIAFFLILAGPVFDDAGNISFQLESLGMGGMIAALVAGIIVGLVMSVFAKHSFFSEDSALPDFITVWFDTLIPMLLILVLGWLLVFQLHINIFDLLYTLFSPILSIGDSFVGFVLLYFIGYTFLYSFGISTWVIYPIESAIVYTTLNANIAAVEAGNIATGINAYGVGTYITIGGGGMTLALGLMMLLLAKSKKLKLMGKVTFVPSMFNINEPLVFGAPMAFNPILMIPMWIAGLVVPALTWIGLNFNIIPKISMLWTFWYLPKPIAGFFLGGISGVLFVLAMFAISWLIYYPFFKVYDRQCVAEEESKELEKQKKLSKVQE